MIKKEEAITRMKMATFESGATQPPRKKIKEKKHRLSLSILKEKPVV